VSNYQQNISRNALLSVTKRLNLSVDIAIYSSKMFTLIMNHVYFSVGNKVVVHGARIDVLLPAGFLRNISLSVE